jgi:hypothetical protein
MVRPTGSAREFYAEAPRRRQGNARKKRDQGEWLQAGVAALYGPNAIAINKAENVS